MLYSLYTIFTLILTLYFCLILSLHYFSSILSTLYIIGSIIIDIIDEMFLTNMVSLLTVALYPNSCCIQNFSTRSLSNTDHPSALNTYFITGFSDALIPSRRNKSSLQKSSECKSLVVWGTNLQSTVGEKFTRKELTMVILTPYTRGVIVGLLLSDG